MGFFRKYFKRHSKQLSVPPDERGLVRKLKYWAVGVVLFFVLWTLFAFLVLKKPGEQFAGFMPIPTLKALYSLTVSNLLILSMSFAVVLYSKCKHSSQRFIITSVMIFLFAGAV